MRKVIRQGYGAKELVEFVRRPLEAVDRIPLVVMLGALGMYPLRRCPRRSCGAGAPAFRAHEDIFRCVRCGAMGGSAMLVAAVSWGWGFDQVHALLNPRFQFEGLDG